MNKIVIVGAGGNAKTIIDTIERNNEFLIEGFIDIGEINKVIYRGYKIIGHDEDIHRIYQAGIHCACVAVGFMGKSDLRQRLYNALKNEGFELPVIIDNSAIIATDAQIGEGSYVGRQAVVNTDAIIGKMCILNTLSVVEHECIVGDFSHISVSAVICGQSKIGNNVMVGSNATVIQRVNINNDCIIGAGTVVTKDILTVGSTAVGIPARIIK